MVFALADDGMVSLLCPVSASARLRHPEPQVLPYVSFLRAGTVETPPYEPVRDMAALKSLLQVRRHCARGAHQQRCTACGPPPRGRNLTLTSLS
jgi:hypothetical protein